MELNKYVPAYMDPRFRQSLPKPADVLILLGEQDTRKQAQLLYEDPETKEQYLVPNCWYNQTLQVQISSHEWNLARYREALSRMKSEQKMKPDDRLLGYRLEDQKRCIARLESHIEQLRVRRQALLI